MSGMPKGMLTEKSDITQTATPGSKGVTEYHLRASETKQLPSVLRGGHRPRWYKAEEAPCAGLASPG